MNVVSMALVILQVADTMVGKAFFPRQASERSLFTRNEYPPLMYCKALSSDLSGAGVRIRWK